MCLTQLTDIVLTGKDKEVHNGMILVGLNNSFDTLDHTIPLKKMKSLASNISNWMV